MKALRVAIGGILREYISIKDLSRISRDMGKRQSKENLMSKKIIKLDSIGHYDFSVLIETPNGSSHPISTFYIERAFQQLCTHPIPS